jgi:hypothetical protein
MIQQWLIASYAPRTIAFDAATYWGIVNPWKVLTFSHTCTWSNRILFVGFFAGNIDSASSVTYNWVSMTQIGKALSDRYTYLYYLINPASGANNVVITITEAWTALAWCASSYNWASQTGQLDSSSTGTASGVNNLTLTTTVVATNSWTVWVWHPNVGSSLVAGSWTTIRANSTAGLWIADSNWWLSAWSRTLNTSLWTNQIWAWVIASFKP